MIITTKQGGLQVTPVRTCNIVLKMWNNFSLLCQCSVANHFDVQYIMRLTPIATCLNDLQHQMILLDFQHSVNVACHGCF